MMGQQQQQCLPSCFPRGLRVLLVDSEEQLAKIEGQLRQPELQYQVTCAMSATDALSCSRVSGLSSFDIVLADARIVAGDDVTGKAFVDAFEDVPVVLMAESGETEDVMRSVKLGAVDFLDKPLSMQKLKNIWQHCVRMMMKKSTLYDSNVLRPSFSDPDMVARGMWGEQQSMSACLPSSMTAPMVGYGGFQQVQPPTTCHVSLGAPVHSNAEGMVFPNKSSVDSPGTPSASDGDLADSISAVSAPRQSIDSLHRVQQVMEGHGIYAGQTATSEPLSNEIAEDLQQDGWTQQQQQKKRKSLSSDPAAGNTIGRPPLACKPSSYGPMLPAPPPSQWPTLEPGCAWGTPVGGTIPPPPMQPLLRPGYTNSVKCQKLLVKPSASLCQGQGGLPSGIECDIHSGEFFKRAKSGGPLGLKLRKSDSLLDLINSTLEGSQTAGC
eukprot:jgi/Picsp_1/3359/NSC_06197-R1_type b response regulator